MRLGDGEIGSLVAEFSDLARRSGSVGVSRSVELADRLEAGELADVFRTARGIAFDELGPQHLFGGPGPWYRWRISDALLQLEYHSRGIRMSLLPKEETEKAEYDACEWGDRDYLAAEVGVWVAEFENGGMWNGYSPGGTLAPDWDTFQEWATDTLRTLESDLTVLDMGLSFLMTPVRGDARSIRVFVEPGMIHAVASQPHYMDRQILASFGWQAAQDGAWTVVREMPSHEDVQYLARLITTTLRAYGLDLNRINYATTCRYSGWVNLLGLGLGHL
jgi:hypothetical protein